LKILNILLVIEKLVLKKEILNLTLNLIKHRLKHLAEEDFLLLI